MTPPKVTIIGSNMIDLITNINRLPEEGETIDARSFQLGFGGKGANQAVVASLLGAEVTIITRVGNDLFGREVIENLKNHKIDTQFVEVVEESSNGVAPIFVDQEGKNRILIFRGANSFLKPDDIDGCREALLESDVVLIQLEIPLETVYYSIEFLKKHNIPIILNPAPAAELDFEKIKSVEIFIPNEVELETIVGEKLDNLEEVEKACRELINNGLKNVIVTLGETGALFVNKETAELVPSIEVNPVDTTGAGDAFIGSFATFYKSSNDLLGSIKKANQYAALSTLKAGTQNSYLSLEQFNKKIIQDFS